MKPNITHISGSTFTENSQQEEQQLTMQRRKQIEKVDNDLIRAIFKETDLNRELKLDELLCEYEKILHTNNDLDRSLEAMYIYSQMAFILQAQANYEIEFEYLQKTCKLAETHQVPTQKIKQRIESCKQNLDMPKVTILESQHEIIMLEKRQKHIKRSRLFNLGVNTLFGTDKSVLSHLPKSTANTESPESLLKLKRSELGTIERCLTFYEYCQHQDPNNDLLRDKLLLERASLGNQIEQLTKEIILQNLTKLAHNTEAVVNEALQKAKICLDAGNLTQGLQLIRRAHHYLNSPAINTSHFKNNTLANLESYIKSIETLENYLKFQKLLPSMYAQRILALVIHNNMILFEIHKDRIEKVLITALYNHWYKIHGLSELQLNGLLEGLAVLIKNDLESKIAGSIARSSLSSALTLYFNSIFIATGSISVLGLKHSKAMPHMLENLIAAYPESGKPYTLPLFPDQEFFYNGRITNTATADRRIDVMPTLDKWEAWLRDDKIKPSDKTALIENDKQRFKWQYNLQQGSIVAPPALTAEEIPVGSYETTANAAKSNRSACYIQ